MDFAFGGRRATPRRHETTLRCRPLLSFHDDRPNDRVTKKPNRNNDEHVLVLSGEKSEKEGGRERGRKKVRQLYNPLLTSGHERGVEDA